MIVMKFGGSSLKDPASIYHAVEIIKENSFSNRIVVVSAVFGVTNLLEKALACPFYNESANTINNLQKLHHNLADNLIKDTDIRSRVKRGLDCIITKILNQLKHTCHDHDLRPMVRDAVLSAGERLSSILIAGCLQDMNVNAIPVESDKIGMETEGSWGNGTVVIEKARKNMLPFFKNIFKQGATPIVTGFFGSTGSGKVITFGRGGSDYSAAVLSRALNASYLEIWKDVKGFLTGSPDIVRQAKLISSLSYEEAAELAFFGAKILHPRTVEPLAGKSIPIVIRSTSDPQSPGTWIGEGAYIKNGIVKSVTFDRNIALIKIHGANIGYTANLLSEIVSELSSISINIRSVFASQTCINILLNKSDLNAGFNALDKSTVSGIGELEKVANLGLIAIVGHGMEDANEVVSKAFSSVIENNIDVDIVLSGASRVASYFLVKENLLQEALSIIHEQFFSDNN